MLDSKTGGPPADVAVVDEATVTIAVPPPDADIITLPPTLDTPATAGSVTACAVAVSVIGAPEMVANDEVVPDAGVGAVTAIGGEFVPGPQLAIARTLPITATSAPI